MIPSQELLDLALRLPTGDRAAIARQLLLSLDSEPYDEGCEAAWDEEIAARMRRLKDGAAQIVGWRESLQRLRAKIAARTKP